MKVDTTFTQAATFFSNMLQQGPGIQIGIGKLVAFLQQRRVILTQKIQGKQGDVFEFYSGIFDRSTHGQTIGSRLIFNFGPEHPGGINQLDVTIQVDLLCGTGNCRFVADLGGFAVQQCVQVSGFADIGNAYNHDTDNPVFRLA